MTPCRSRWMMLGVLAAGLVPTVSVAWGEDAVPPVRQGAPPERIAGWIRDLDSDEFETRSRATEHLLETGQAAIEPVAQAALAGSPELAARCIGILETFYAAREDGKDTETSAAAKVALENLAAGDNKPVAQRAAAVIRPPQPQPGQGNFPFPFGGPVRIQVRAIQQGQVIGGQGQPIRRRTQVRINGDSREIEVEENGRTVRITDQAGQNIVVRVEETDADGNKTPTEWKAKDLDVLKKLDPEAAKLYEQYTGNAGPIRVLGGAGKLRIQQLPGGVLPVQPVPPVLPEKQ